MKIKPKLGRRSSIESEIRDVSYAADIASIHTYVGRYLCTGTLDEGLSLGDLVVCIKILHENVATYRPEHYLGLLDVRVEFLLFQELCSCGIP